MIEHFGFAAQEHARQWLSQICKIHTNPRGELNAANAAKAQGSKRFAHHAALEIGQAPWKLRHLGAAAVRNDDLARR